MNIELIQQLLDEIDARTGQIRSALVQSQRTVRLKPGDNLQAAMDSALAGEYDVLALAPGPYAQPLAIKTFGKNHVTVTVDAGLDTRRPDRSNLPNLPQLRTPLVGPTLTVAPRAGNVTFRGIAFPAVSDANQALVQLGTDTLLTPDAQPARITLDRCLLFGDPVRGQKRGVMAHATQVQILGSAFYDFHYTADSQCVSAWNGGQRLELVGNFFEASGENVMFGGGRSRAVEMIPSDILLVGNEFSKNSKWKTLGTPVAVKCLLELKNAKRVTARGNLFQHNWADDWPTGVAIMVKCTDQSGDEPWTTCEDVLIESNVIRRVGGVFGFVARNDANHVTQLMKRIKILNNLAYDIRVGEWTGRGQMMASADLPQGLEIGHNTFLGNASTTNLFVWWMTAGAPKGEGFNFHDNVAWPGTYGFKRDGGGMGWPALLVDTLSPVMQGNVLRRAANVNTLPANNVAALAESGFDTSFNPDRSVRAGSAIATAVTSTDGRLPGIDPTASMLKEAMALAG